jgi:uncharacterized membrane protein YphA (DoxX/SURF4 family)
MSTFKGAYEYQAFRILQVAFIIAPILAGLDKFFYYLTNWSRYLSPVALQFMQGNERYFMMAVGIVEIVVGIGVIFKPRLFAYIIVAWLLCIIINLLLLREFFDIALRDFGLLLAALALAKLSRKFASNH